MASEEPSTPPEWMVALENKSKRHRKLAHDIGAGARCLSCQDKCQGLDLHFWRKICRNCKCKREDHDIKEEDSFEQFEILFGETLKNSLNLKMDLKEQSADIATSANMEGDVKFDWIPTDISLNLACEYMKQLPAEKLPITGSEGAQFRRQQLQKQLPLHDFKLSETDRNFTPEETHAFNDYVQNLKENVVGKGCIMKISPPRMEFLKTLNSTPKPFKPYTQVVLDDADIEEEEFPPPPPELLESPEKHFKLKTPSAFKPKAKANPIAITASPEHFLHLSAAFKPEPFEIQPPDTLSSETETAKPGDKGVIDGVAKMDLSDVWDCHQCGQSIKPGQVVIVADRAGGEVYWHPTCFVCVTCKELLVDLVYFFYKNKVYCGRHYARVVSIPRCFACDELIFLTEYTEAEGNTFHVNHFCCIECDKPLAGLHYVHKEDHPVCLPCYETKYGKACHCCGRMIGAMDTRVGWQNLSWHATERCFKCVQCAKSLLGGKFVVKMDKPLCSKECFATFANI